jgi:hypothetical protein
MDEGYIFFKKMELVGSLVIVLCCKEFTAAEM